MSREDIIKQVTILKMKENYKHDSEAFNLINDSDWDGKEDDANRLCLKDPTSKIKSKMLKSLKQALYNKIQLLMFLGCVHGLLYIKLRITQIEM